MNLIRKKDKRIQLNILPFPVEEVIIDNKVAKLKEGGLALYEDFREQEANSIREIDQLKINGEELVYNHKGFSFRIRVEGKPIVTMMEGRGRIGFKVRDSSSVKLIALDNLLYVNTRNIIVEHDCYNARIRYLQPLGVVEEELSRATITSPTICVELASKNTVCIVSVKPIRLEYYPGKILVATSSEAQILFSRKMFEWNNALSILWSLVNRPVEVSGDPKTILWRITPYTVKPLYFEAKPLDDKRMYIKTILWNSTLESVQATLWVPAKILEAKSVDYSNSEVEELIPDYDRVRSTIPPQGIILLELKLLRLPPLFLKELMRRNILSPYTPP